MKNKKLTIEQVYEQIRDREERFIRHTGCFDLTEFEKQNKLPYKFTLEDACGLIDQNERWRLIFFLHQVQVVEVRSISINGGSL